MAINALSSCCAVCRFTTCASSCSTRSLEIDSLFVRASSAVFATWSSLCCEIHKKQLKTTIKSERRNAQWRKHGPLVQYCQILLKTVFESAPRSLRKALRFAGREQSCPGRAGSHWPRVSVPRSSALERGDFPSRQSFPQPQSSKEKEASGHFVPNKTKPQADYLTLAASCSSLSSVTVCSRVSSKLSTNCCLSSFLSFNFTLNSLTVPFSKAS